MKKIFLCLLFCLALNHGWAQERIDTDRPDQTESAFTVPKNFFQGEFGFGKENAKNKNYQLAHPAFLVKYGISKKMELRLEGNFFSEYLYQLPNTESSFVFDPLEIGAKLKLLDEKNWLPQTSLIVHLGLPFTTTGSNAGQSVFPSFRFVFQHGLGSTTGVGANFGAAWDGYGGRPVWLYTLSPNINIGKNWYAYVELFGFMQSNELSQHNIDAGIAYYISSNTKLDVSAGAGLGNSELKNYAAIGFSFRIGPK
ncbi:MAG: transporter [Flavisolibacter sp.]